MLSIVWVCQTYNRQKSQVEKFRELAREIETVDSEEPLNAAIRKVAKSPPAPKDDKKPKGRLEPC